MYIFAWLSVGRTDLTDILSILQYSLSNTREHCLHLTEEESDGNTSLLHTAQYILFTF